MLLLSTFGTRRVKSLGNFKLVKTHEEDTAVRAVSPPSMFLYGSIRGTSLEASEEVSITRATTDYNKVRE